MNKAGCLYAKWTPCPLGEGEVVVGLALGNWHGLSARPILKRHMEWEHPPFLSEESRSVEVDVPQPHPCYLRMHPSYPWGPWLFFVVYCPSKEPHRFPLVYDLASSSSNLAWPIGRDQWEKEEEEELQEVAFWGPLSNFPLCSCWLTGLSNPVFSSGPLLLLPFRIPSLSEQ